MQFINETCFLVLFFESVGIFEFLNCLGFGAWIKLEFRNSKITPIDLNFKGLKLGNKFISNFENLKLKFSGLKFFEGLKLGFSKINFLRFRKIKLAIFYFEFRNNNFSQVSNRRYLICFEFLFSKNPSFKPSKN
jgi:hypothetical protein